ncbi:MAG: metalloregulator ArsR/SmtB family transcription factor [Acidobacteria bacterium]|nr:metalloregulator ArsR/SmtB family transcription factor [Acidobacteriota bacterium]
MTQMAKLFRALADANRLRIVNILSERSICVCDLQSVLDLSQPFISRHLAYLRRVGLVKDRREGPRVCYSLAPNSPVIHALRAFLRDALSTSETFRFDLETLNNLEMSGRLKSLGVRILSGPADGAAAPVIDEVDTAEDAEERAA